MKVLFSIIVLSFLFLFSLHCQTVDSVKAEQAGDLIKINYRIINSNQNQLFKVMAFCSINGKPRIELKSLSGDFGNNIIGGKQEYLILWDVLKDVDELKSAEFIITAELIKGIPSKIITINTTGWDKKRLHIFVIVQNPGPKVGAKIGYLGNWGFTAEFANGKVKPVRPGFPFTSIELPSKTTFSFEITKRLFNKDEFQCHLAGGISNTPTLFAESQDMTAYQFRNLIGPHINVILGIKSIVATFGFCGVASIGKVEKSNDLLIITNDTYFDLGLGLRF